MQVLVLQYMFKQLDLSDDEMVHDMFADQASWEEDMADLQSVDESGTDIGSISQESFYDWWRWSGNLLQEQGVLGQPAAEKGGK